MPAVTAKVWDKNMIQTLLNESDVAVVRALQRIYDLQTADEKSSAHTNHRNNVGFNQIDAPILTDMVQRLNQWGSLRPKQIALVRKKLQKYWKQLVNIANEKELARTPMLQSATIPTVSPDRGSYNRLQQPRMCGCEANDGEVLAADCDKCSGTLFGELEAAQERAAYEAKVRNEDARRAARVGVWS